MNPNITEIDMRRCFLALLASLTPAALRAEDAPSVQARVDAAVVAYEGRAAVRIAEGVHDLSEPIRLDRAGVGLLGEPGARLRTRGCFPAVISGIPRPQAEWVDAHLVQAGGTAAAWRFGGDSRLVLPASPFDCGPWSGASVWNSELTFWRSSRVIGLELVAVRDSDAWGRQFLLGQGRDLPRPLRLFADAGRAFLELLTEDGRKLTARWPLPAAPELSLEVAVDRPGGSVRVRQNGAEPPVTLGGDWATPWVLSEPDGSDDFSVGGSLEPGIYPHGRWTLHRLRLTSDGAEAVRLGPVPPEVARKGLWRWDGPGVWGYGLLIPTAWRNGGGNNTARPWLERLEIAGPDGLPYGANVLVGLTYDLNIRDCIFLHGASGLRQVRRDTCYVNRILNCRFIGHKDSAIDLDFGISEIRGCYVGQGRLPRALVRLRRHQGGIYDTKLQHEPRASGAAIELPLLGQLVVQSVVVDWEDESKPVGRMIRASRGRDNGGVTRLAIRDTPGCRVAPGGCLVELLDGQGGAVDYARGRGLLLLDAALESYWYGKDGPRTPPERVRASGPWTVEGPSAPAPPTNPGSPPSGPAPVAP